MKRTAVLLSAVMLSSCAHDEVKPTTTPTPVAATAEPKAPAPAPVAVTAVAPDPWADKSKLFVAPKMTPTTKVNLGAIDRFTLPNGLAVIVVARHEAPVIDVALVVKGGALRDPIDRVGLAELTAHVLRKGTKKRTADQLADAIETVGGRLSSDVDNQATYVSCGARAKDLALCLDLMSDVVEHPTFPQAEIDRERTQLIATIEQAKDDPGTLVEEHAENLYFGDHDVRGRVESVRSVNALDRAQLLAYFNTWYAPNNSVLAIAGDFDPRTIRAQLVRAFAGWKKHAVPAIAPMTLPPPPSDGRLQVRLVDKPDATQSEVEILGPGIAHSDPDYPAARLMNYSLGAGVFSSRLMKVVRSQGGKTYSAHSAYWVGRDPGTFLVSTFTRNAETGATVKLALDEVKRMQSSGPTQEELDAAKGNMIGGFGLSLETGSDLARTLLVAEIDGLGPHFVETYLDRLNQVTLADVKKAAAEHLRLTSLVVVGKAAEIKSNLEKSGFPVGEVVDYAAPVSAADRQALADEKKNAGHVDPQAAAAGQLLLDQATKAMGGAAARKIHGLKIAASGTLAMQGQQMPLTVTIFDVPQKSRRVEMNIGPMKIVQVVAEKSAFMQQGDQVKDLPAAMATAARRELAREPQVLLVNGTSNGTKVRALPAATEGTARFDVLELISTDGDATQLWLDPTTHRVSRMTYKDEGKETREDFSDYRVQNGVAFAWKSTRVGGDGEKIEMTYQKIEIDPELPATLFTH